MCADSRTIVAAQSDEEILDLLLAELQARIDAALHDDLDAYVEELKGLPIGLRAMAATYQLDVSITLDDLGWHFGNWHHHGYAMETAEGLRALGALRAAEIFEAAHSLALRYWEEMGSENWMEWYNADSPLAKAVEPLTREMWELVGDDRRIMQYWVDYARRNPGLLLE